MVLQCGLCPFLLLNFFSALIRHILCLFISLLSSLNRIFVVNVQHYYFFFVNTGFVSILAMASVLNSIALSVKHVLVERQTVSCLPFCLTKKLHCVCCIYV